MNLFPFLKWEGQVQPILTVLSIIECLIFAFLFSVWILPETAVLRNTALITGAIFAVLILKLSKNSLLVKEAIPIYLIALLFLWIIFLYIFYPNEPTAQFNEIKSIWKRVVLITIFAIGLGVSISIIKNKAYTWPIILVGFIAPILIYLIKWAYSFGFDHSILSIRIPWLRVYDGSTLFYVPKSEYVAFSMPVLAIAIGQLGKALQEKRALKSNAIYSLIILSITFLFYAQNIKNGFIYELFLIGIFLIRSIKYCFYSGGISKKILTIFIFIFIGSMTMMHISKNNSWKYFSEDFKIAINTSDHEEWKYAGEKGYPQRESGATVSTSTYERLAWAVIGAKLALESPAGYGLVENSFGPLVRKRWPEASKLLSHSHSGWIDLLLGVGIVGVSLIALSIFFVFIQNSSSDTVWAITINWALIGNILCWCTTELAANTTFEVLIFWIVFGASLNIGRLKS